MSKPWWWQLKLRPHHLLDIITRYGQGRSLGPGEYGHRARTVAGLVLADQRQAVKLVVGADDICVSCRHLTHGRCTDTIDLVDPPLVREEYNRGLDRGLLAHLGLREGEVLTVGAFAETVLERLLDIEQVCLHPGEDASARLRQLRQGLQKLGVGGGRRMVPGAGSV